MFPLQGGLPKTEPPLWRGGTYSAETPGAMLQQINDRLRQVADVQIKDRLRQVADVQANDDRNVLPGLPVLFVPSVSCAGFVAALQ